MSNAANTSLPTMLPPSRPFALGLSASAVGVACDVANHLAAVPMLREMLAVKDAALEAAKRHVARLEAENARLRSELQLVNGVAAGLARQVIADDDNHRHELGLYDRGERGQP